MPNPSQEMVSLVPKGDEELLKWYLTTLNLRKLVESLASEKSTSNSSTESIDHLHQRHKHPQDLLAKKKKKHPQGHRAQQLQQKPSEALWNVVENNGDVPKDDPRPPKSEWVVSIEEKLKQACQDDMPGSRAKVSIYRFPHYLKDGEKKAWVPQIVSLGPYHHGEKHLCRMDKHKRRCLYHILKRCNHELGLYLDSVKKVEKKARACYEGTIPMESNEFVEMMVFDGCFLIELFQGVDKGFEALGYPRNDSIFSTRRSMHRIQRDIIMLENQIPLFILDRLLCLQLGVPNQKGIVARLALNFFDPSALTNFNRLEFNPLSDQRLHCLEAFRWSILHSLPKREGNQMPLPQERLQGREQLIQGVRELWEAGIKLKRNKTDNFLDIQFKDGILRIPQLVIHDGTRSLFLNLIAFEQCNFDCSNHITSYIIFMDQLINSPRDVRYLHVCGVIEPCIGTNAQVADIFNQLCQEVAFDVNDGYLGGLSRQVVNYYKDKSWRAILNRKYHAWRAILKEEYFSNPWSIISLIAAFILLVLTFTQTLYGVYGYYRLGS